MNTMKQRYEQAKKLVETKNKITLRMILKNGNLADRTLAPIMHASNATNILYSDTLILYKAKDASYKIDIFNVDYSKLMKITKEILPHTTTEKGVILYKLETLLESGYQIIE